MTRKGWGTAARAARGEIPLLALAAILLAILLAPMRSSFAQSPAPPEVHAEVDSNVVAVGEPFTVQLTILTDGGGPEPQDPTLSVPAGLNAARPGISSQTQISVVNGRLSRKTGITASWSVVAAREGTFNIPGPTVSWNGQRLRANPLRVIVRAAPPGGANGAQGGFPRGLGPRGFNPFDPFGMMPRFPGSLFDDPQDQPQIVPSDPALTVEQAPDPSVFLRAVTDKKSAVIGEQVTLTIYVYTRINLPTAPDRHEPALADFLRRDLLDPNAEPDVKTTLIGGVPWRVQTIFRAALFPIKAGDLAIGPMRVTFRGSRALGPNGTGLRESQPLTVHVTEPPAAGRPAGYALGNVGQYGISASVEPRTTEVGGAVAITVTVTASGNPPSSIPVPASNSVEWLEPQTRESIDADATGKVHGSRTFAYVVRPKVAGNIDLGSIVLPYWDPASRAYATARADLGSIQAAPGAAAAAGDPGAHVDADPLASISGPRTALGPAMVHITPLSDRRWFWLLLFGAPLGVIAISYALRNARAAYEGWTARRSRPTVAIDQALADARRAERDGDPRAAAACLERAVHTAIEASTSLRARALLLDEVAPALVARGLPPNLAGGARDLLGQLESLRFSPAAGAALPGLIPQAESLVRNLRRAPARRRA